MKAIRILAFFLTCVLCMGIVPSIAVSAAVTTDISLVGVQMRTNEDGTQDIRFVIHAEAKEYSSLGITIRVEEVADGDKGRVTYKAQGLTTDLLKPTVSGGGKEYKPSDVGKSGGSFYAGSLHGFAAKSSTHVIFTVTPTAVRANGSKISGEAVKIQLNGTEAAVADKYDYRIMTFNVLRADQRKNSNGEVIDYKTIDFNKSLQSITDYDPDVVGFQEYCAAFTGNLTKKLNDNGYTMIGNPYDTERTDPSGKTLYVDQNMAPLAYKTEKFNCLASGAACVPGTYAPPTNPYPGHWITWAVLQDKVTGDVFAVANTHGFHKSQEDLKSTGQIKHHVPKMIETFYNLMNNAEAKAVKGEDFVCPVLFVGDYNMKQTSDPYKALFNLFKKNAKYDASYGVLADARRVALKDYTTGGASHYLGQQGRSAKDEDMIDHIFVTQDVGVVEHHIGVSATTAWASDHYPVFADVIVSN